MAAASGNADLQGCFRSPFKPRLVEPLTRREQALLSLACAIRDKKDWARKILDPVIRSKWTEEATLQAQEEPWVEEVTDGEWDSDGSDADLHDKPMRNNLVRFPADNIKDMIAELHAWAEADVQAHNSPISLGAVTGTYVADHPYIPNSLLEALISGAKALESSAVPDWHPGSDNQVLDLVHPSLYCLVYGISWKVAHQAPYTSDQFLAKPDATEVVTKVQGKPFWPQWFTSKKFQWLPSDFSIDPAGKVTIESYINNLHPHKHQELYTTISKIFELFVPMFNNVLTEAAAAPVFERIVPSYQPGVHKIIDLKGRRVQVIVKLANIHLTPGSPSYPGGSWHVEGMEDENIVASGIYYYSQDNVTDSSLAFRMAVREPNYEQDDRRGVRNEYGLDRDKPLNQLLGRVTTLPGRCLCFPNIYQHQVQPFQLADPSRPGHRKILVFFLVNPATRITSTADVPPQRLDWLLEHDLDYLFNDKGSRFYSLPMQAKEMLIRHLEDQPQAEDAPPPFTLARAKLYREQLMEERRQGVQMQNMEVFEVPFSMCEH